jgi:hypothetical protein
MVEREGSQKMQRPIKLSETLSLAELSGGYKLEAERFKLSGTLSLAGYDFFIDLAKFYSTDSTLITYTRVYLEIRDKNQKSLAKKRIRIK